MIGVTTYTLSVWLMVAAPAPPPQMPFGPFYSAGECEEAFGMVKRKYRGKIELRHTCDLDGAQ